MYAKPTKFITADTEGYRAAWQGLLLVTFAVPEAEGKNGGGIHRTVAQLVTFMAFHDGVFEAAVKEANPEPDKGAVGLQEFPGARKDPVNDLNVEIHRS